MQENALKRQALAVDAKNQEVQGAIDDMLQLITEKGEGARAAMQFRGGTLTFSESAAQQVSGISLIKDLSSFGGAPRRATRGPT